MYSLELCAGGGGQALGLEQAGFDHTALVEIDRHCCNTLRANRPNWNVFEQDLTSFNGAPFKGVDLVAGGVPCPPFSKAGKQLGKDDERNLFPTTISLIDQIRPRAVMIENVRGLLDPQFDDYRKLISKQIEKFGYKTDWRLLNASEFGVSQLRPRVVLIAINKTISEKFDWPVPNLIKPQTVGELLYDLMTSNQWCGAKTWKKDANQIAPTIVGGSKKHGGPDLGPTRAKRAWASLGIDGSGIANEPPEKEFIGLPKLTNRMAARIQGFPDDWEFTGKKTPAYRQIGNAFPPPVAMAVGISLLKCLSSKHIFQISSRKTSNG